MPSAEEPSAAEHGLVTRPGREMLRSMFVFPSDVAILGADATAASLGNAGCNGIMLSAGYHRSRHLHPRWPRSLTAYQADDGVAFEPNTILYEGTVAPPVDRALASAGVMHLAREAALKRGQRFEAWLMGLHNSALGIAHPELTSENAFGDRFHFALCPANPQARRYVTALARDVVQQFEPVALALESVTYMGWRHGEHHELSLVPLCETAWQLLSLCFCKHCGEAARERGVDVERLQEDVRRRVRTLIEDERGLLTPAFTLMEMAQLLVEWPDLTEFVRMRLEIVGSLMRQIWDSIRPSGTELLVIPSIFPRHIVSMSWGEGVSLTAMPSWSSAALLLSYFPESAMVRADVRWFKAMAPDHPFGVGLNVGQSDCPDRAHLYSSVQIAREEGGRAIYYYNYGLLNNERLSWIQNANAFLAS